MLVVCGLMVVLGAWHVGAEAQTTTRVSVATGGGQGNAGSRNTTILSANGRFVAFDSAATNLAPGDTNVVDDIFVYDCGSATVIDPSHPDVNGDCRTDVIWHYGMSGQVVMWFLNADSPVSGAGFPDGAPISW